MGANGIDNARELEILYIQGMMSSKDGRSFMYRMLEQSGVMHDSFTPDPYTHAHKAGQRSTGVWLQNELMEASFENYMTMLKEHKDE